MKTFPTFIICLQFSLSGFVQTQPLLEFSATKTNYAVCGQVQDFITREPLAGVKAQILSADSVLLFEWRTDHQSGIHNKRQVKSPYKPLG